MSTNLENILVSIVGPTAVGKTAFSVELAEHYGCEILSVDSRQLYKELNIGTAKPTKHELERVKHHFVGSHSIESEINVATYESEVLNVLPELFNEQGLLIAVGGSGLFFKTIWEGLDQIPAVDPVIRQEVNDEISKNGLKNLLDELKSKDLEYYNSVDKKNSRRVGRAIEVIRTTGLPFSAFRQGERRPRDFSIVKVGLDMNREELYQRIDSRMDAMITEGLFEEAKELFHKRELNALQTVGYREIFGYLDQEYDYNEAVRLLKRNSRRYAKRQLTWFKKDQEILWFTPNQREEVIAHLDRSIKYLRS